MQKVIVLSQADIKKIIAEHFKVKEDKVVPTRYSFIVLEEEDDGKPHIKGN